MTAEQLEAARSERMRQNGHGAITFEDVRTWIEETGLCVYLSRSPQAGFNAPTPTPTFVEAVAGRHITEPNLELIGSAPGRTDRSADGGTIDFGVSPGMGSTAYLEVVTNETNYNFMGTLSLYTEDFQSPATVIINGIYGPSATAPVPEPASMALLGTGLLGVAILKRRYAR